MSMKSAPLLFGFALFLSSALLFVIQPVLGRTMLPHLGGNPLAWNACLVFFQTTLLAGYIYAGLLHRIRGLRWQPWLQLVLMAAAITLLFVGVFGERMLLDLAPRLTTLDTVPIISTFALLIVVIGFPYLVLAAVGPLLQRWFAHLEHPRASDPYFLIVAGNLGGLTSLVLYPLLVEPNSVLRGQWLSWKLALCGLGVLLFLTAFFVWRSPRNPELEPNEDPNAPAVPLLIGRGPATWPRRWYWLAASGLPVALTMGATDYLTLDVAPVPLLWALPLALYLFAFSQAFARFAPFQRGGFTYKMFTQSLYGFVLLLFGAILLFVLTSRDPELGGAPAVNSVIVFALLLFMPSSWLQFAQPLALLGLVYIQVSYFGESSLASGRILLILSCCYLSVRLCLERLADERPAATALTTYFTWIGLGGLLGGVVQLLVVPFVFRWGYVEFAAFAAVAGVFRPAWLRNGLIDWIAGQVFFPRREVPAKPWLALAFDFLLPGFVAAAVIALFLTRRNLQPGDFDLPLIFALLYAVVLIARPVRYGLALIAIVCLGWIGLQRSENQVVIQRTHFGILQVVQGEVRAPKLAGLADARLTERRLMHGTTLHGSCITDPPEWRRHPTSYYHRKGPIGHVMRKLDSFGGLRKHKLGFWIGDVRAIDNSMADLRVAASLVGLAASPLGLAATLDTSALWSEQPIAIVGLGAGALLNYTHPTQWVDAFELDPAIIALSEGSNPVFPCYQNATERCVNARLIVGDGRRSLSKPGRERFYQVIVVDAFNSGSIPIHLLTTEAIELYFEKLTRDGVICIHTSNRYLDLPRPLDLAARKLEVAMTVLDSSLVKDEEATPTALSSQWVVLARNQATLQQWTDGIDRQKVVEGVQPLGRPGAALKLLWTDEHASLRSALKNDQHWAHMIQAMLIVILLWESVMGFVELIHSMQPRSVKP